MCSLQPRVTQYSFTHVLGEPEQEPVLVTHQQARSARCIVFGCAVDGSDSTQTPLPQSNLASLLNTYLGCSCDWSSLVGHHAEHDKHCQTRRVRCRTSLPNILPVSLLQQRAGHYSQRLSFAPVSGVILRSSSLIQGLNFQAGIAQTTVCLRGEFLSKWLSRGTTSCLVDAA